MSLRDYFKPKTIAAVGMAGILFVSFSFAQEPPQQQKTEKATSAAPAKVSKKPSQGSSGVKKRKKSKAKVAKTRRIRRRWKREKKTDGTKALSRFENDGVIKSKYRYRGRRLDVDPD